MATLMKRVLQITRLGKLKPFLSSKTTNHSKITFIENDKVINDDTKVAETLNSFLQKLSYTLKFQYIKLHPS